MGLGKVVNKILKKIEPICDNISKKHSGFGCRCSGVSGLADTATGIWLLVAGCWSVAQPGAVSHQQEACQQKQETSSQDPDT